MSDKPKRTITPDDERAAKNLRRIWDAKKKAKLAEGKKFSEGIAAEQLGWTQGAVNQFLNCGMALNYLATLKWANFLDVAPESIRPDFAADFDVAYCVARKHGPNARLMDEINKLPDVGLQAVEDLVCQLCAAYDAAPGLFSNKDRPRIQSFEEKFAAIPRSQDAVKVKKTDG